MWSSLRGYYSLPQTSRPLITKNSLNIVILSPPGSLTLFLLENILSLPQLSALLSAKSGIKMLAAKFKESVLKKTSQRERSHTYRVELSVSFPAQLGQNSVRTSPKYACPHVPGREKLYSIFRHIYLYIKIIYYYVYNIYLTTMNISMWFPCWLSGKESACQGGRCGFNPWVGKTPWRTKVPSSILAWEIPWTEEPGGLQSMRLRRVGHN